MNQSVLVVGAGPAGAATALSLAREGMRVVLIDAEREPNLSPRAIVYLHPLLPDLDRLGILDDMRSRGHIDHEGFNMHLVALDEILSAPNSELEGASPTPYNIHMGQGEFTQIVIEHLAKLDTVDVRWGSRLVGFEQDDSGVTATIETDAGTEQLRVGWLIGADGGRSTVRDLIGATLEGSTWDERFVAVNLRYDFRSIGMRSSNLYVHPTLPAVIAQIDKSGLWRCTFQESADLPEETVEERVHAYLHALLGEDAEYELVAFRPYRMHQRLASKLREGRVLLVGDAAHLTNPTGGLGLTTGLYDVLALEEVLPAVARGEAGEEALDRFAADRSRVFSEITSPTASMLKNVVYGGLEPEALREATAMQRQFTSTHEQRVAMLLGLDAVRSPSLLQPESPVGAVS
ncbi:FAD-dependent oxidoreductase [Microbacterium sp. UBA3394]|uniref:FAD-dependent oxidoreductase n=1 Tax=Microbacterium sp. UBA3394 TaxID=1946945 RepID=UPI00257AAE54|nr:FAD-dependent oxidoreductase [Microbacterium sp. UBA3394]